MNDKIKKFRDICYKNLEILINNNGWFHLEEEKEPAIIIYPPRKIINFLKGNTFLKSLDDLFLIKEKKCLR